MADKKWGGHKASPKCEQVRRKPDEPTKAMKRLARKNRNSLKLYRRRINAGVTGKHRPLSKLDEQAKSLGVYNAAYHCMNRKERKSIVSTALSAIR